jgi:hypothetical protein
MANLYCSPTGNDTTGNGSLENPYKHIHKCIDVSSSNDVIYCLDGTYDEEVGRTIGTKNLTIHSYSNDYTKVIIKPLTLYTGSVAGRTWIYYDQAYKFSIYDVTIIFDQNFISNVASNWNSIFQGYNPDKGVRFEIIRCFLLAQNWSSTRQPCGMLSPYNDGVSAYKSTFRGFINGTYDCRALAPDTNGVSGGTLNVKDCIFENCRTAIYNSATITNIVEDYNSFYNNYSNKKYGSLGAHDITSNPDFLTSAGAEVDTDSPCRNAGIVVAGYIETYEETYPDIGCYEYTVSVIEISTENASNIESDSVRLNGSVSDLAGEENIKIWWEYGLTDGYGSSTDKETKSAIGSYYTDISELDKDTEYHFRFCASKIDDSGTVYGEDLTFTTLDIISYSFFLKWGLTKLRTGSFGFKWQLSKLHSSVFGLKWKLIFTQKLFNIISYPLFFVTPAIYEFLFKASVSGVLDTANISLGNTGSSGNTVIEIYNDDVLNSTITIPADSSSYNKVIKLVDEFVYNKTPIKIKITSVGIGSSNLVIMVNQKTFNPELRISNVYNKFGSNNYKISNRLFLGADNWILKLNQPISLIEKIKAVYGTTEIELTGTLGDGNYINDMITITPQDISNCDKIIVKVKDLNNEIKTVEYAIEYHSALGSNPLYVGGDTTINTYTHAKQYSYSWDNVNWSTKATVSNYTITVSPTNSLAGGSSLERSRTLYIRYYYSTKYIEENYTLKYFASDVSVSVDFNNRSLIFEDGSLPVSIDIYVDGEYMDTIDIVGTVDGCDTYTVDGATGDLTVSSGTLKTPSAEIAIPETVLDNTIEDPDSTNFIVENKLILLSTAGVLSLGDTSLETFSESDVNIYNEQGYIPLAIVKIIRTTLDGTPYYMILSTVQVYKGMDIPIYESAEVLYVTTDILGRVGTTDLSSGEYSEQDFSYRLVAKNPDTGVEIKPGEIHFCEEVEYSFEERI